MTTRPRNPASIFGDASDDSSIGAIRTLSALSGVIVVLALITALTGLLWQGGGAPESFTSIHGEVIDIYGSGIYRNDSVIRATANKGADAVTLALALPLLVVSLVLVRRRSLRGRLLLFGVLVWFLYNSASLALGTGFNELFLVYVGLMSASLFAFVLAFRSIRPEELARQLGSGPPRRGLTIFMFLIGLVTLVVWLEAPLTSLIRNQPPGVLEHSTTLITHAIDLAIILPAAILAGLLILRRDPLGYVMSIPLLFIVSLLAPMITLQTLFQLDAGVDIPVGMMIGPIGGFMAIGVIAIWLLVTLLRLVSEQEVEM